HQVLEQAVDLVTAEELLPARRERAQRLEPGFSLQTRRALGLRRRLAERRIKEKLAIPAANSAMPRQHLPVSPPAVDLAGSPVASNPVGSAVVMDVDSALGDARVLEANVVVLASANAGQRLDQPGTAKFSIRSADDQAGHDRIL